LWHIANSTSQAANATMLSVLLGIVGVVVWWELSSDSKPDDDLPHLKANMAATIRRSTSSPPSSSPHPPSSSTTPDTGSDDAGTTLQSESISTAVVSTTAVPQPSRRNSDSNPSITLKSSLASLFEYATNSESSENNRRYLLNSCEFDDLQMSDVGSLKLLNAPSATEHLYAGDALVVEFEIHDRTKGTMEKNIALEQHWVALYRRGASHSGANRKWQYLPLHFKYVLQPSGRLAFSRSHAPNEPGEYRLCLHRGTSVDVLATGGLFNVVAQTDVFLVSSPHIRIVPDHVYHNSPVDICVTTGSHRTGKHWIGLYSVGAPDGATEIYQYLPHCQLLSSPRSSTPAIAVAVAPMSIPTPIIAPSLRSSISSLSERLASPTSALTMLFGGDNSLDDAHLLNNPPVPCSTPIDLTFAGPALPGSYEFRYHVNEPYPHVLCISRQFKVRAPELVVSSRFGSGIEDSDPIPLNEPIHLHVITNPAAAEAKDWIGLYPCGAPNGNSHGRWSYLSSADEHIVFDNQRAPDKPGKWEFRYHIGGSDFVIATSHVMIIC
jgi:hypothetical protein